MARTTLITGPTSGIGFELAKIFAQNGHDLVLVARGREKLLELKSKFESENKVRVKTLEKDLSKPSSCAEIFDELKKEDIAPDILVNNAGFGSRGFFHKLDIATQLEMIQLNVTSLTHLTHLLLPKMVEKKWGRILNLASTAAFQPGPLMAVYYATKAYVLSFSEALSNELKGTGVTATALCPGPTRTAFSQRARMGGTHLFHNGLVMSAEEVARTGYRALIDGKAVEVPGFKNKAIAFSVRLSPRSLVRRAARMTQENKK